MLSTAGGGGALGNVQGLGEASVSSAGGMRLTEVGRMKIIKTAEAACAAAVPQAQYNASASGAALISNAADDLRL